ncbi:hypothetical protein M9458_012779, partial [Cirrhinus mrigala]
TAVALLEPRNYRSPSERQTQGIVSRRLEFELMPYGTKGITWDNFTGRSQPYKQRSSTTFILP